MAHGASQAHDTAVVIASMGDSVDGDRSVAESSRTPATGSSSKVNSSNSPPRPSRSLDISISTTNSSIDSTALTVAPLMSSEASVAVTSAGLNSSGQPLEEQRRPFSCPVEDCPSSYNRKSDLKTHLLKKHAELASSHPIAIAPKSSKDGKAFQCPVFACRCGYHRYSDLKVHFLAKHADMLDSYPEFVPRQGRERCPHRTCNERFSHASDLLNHLRLVHLETRPMRTSTLILTPSTPPNQGGSERKPDPFPIHPPNIPPPSGQILPSISHLMTTGAIPSLAPDPSLQPQFGINPSNPPVAYSLQPSHLVRSNQQHPQSYNYMLLPSFDVITSSNQNQNQNLNVPLNPNSLPPPAMNYSPSLTPNVIHTPNIHPSMNPSLIPSVIPRQVPRLGPNSNPSGSKS